MAALSAQRPRRCRRRRVARRREARSAWSRARMPRRRRSSRHPSSAAGPRRPSRSGSTSRAGAAPRRPAGRCRLPCRRAHNRGASFARVWRGRFARSSRSALTHDRRGPDFLCLFLRFTRLRQFSAPRPLHVYACADNRPTTCPRGAPPTSDRRAPPAPPAWETTAASSAAAPSRAPRGAFACRSRRTALRARR